MAVTLLRPGAVLDYFSREVLNPKEKTVDYIIRQLEENPRKKVWLLEAQTGSGKSTVLPPFLYKKFPTKNIVSTQPRVYNAVSIPEQVAEHNKELIIGENMGYSTGDQKVAIKKGLVFMTEPTLLAQLKTMKEEDFIRKWAFIIIDEVHVRSVGLDIMFYKIKRLVERYKELLVFPQFIMTSATFDVIGFSKYYKTDAIMYVEGISFKIEDTFEETPIDSYEYVAKKIIEIHKNDPNYNGDKGDIGLFVPGENVARIVIEELEKLRKGVRPFEILNISSTTRDEIRIILEKKSKNRRIILGTNAIETGVTLNELKYLCDLGIENLQGYHPPTGIKFLLNSPISNSSRRQRRGRVGRKFEGNAVFFYTKQTQENMLENSLPDIQTKDITGEMMYLLVELFELNTLISAEEIVEKYDDIVRKQKALLKSGKKSNEIDCKELLAPPGGDAIARAISNLHRLGYVDIQNIPTKLGLIMHKLPMCSFESARTIMSGVVFDISLKELIVLTQLMEHKKDLLLKPKDTQPIDILQHFCKKFKFEDKFHNYILDEAIHLLLYYHSFKHELKKSPSKAKKWCEASLINYKTFVICLNNTYNILKTFDTIGVQWRIKNQFKLKRYIKYFDVSNDWMNFVDYITRLKMCIYQGYKMNLITRNERGFWKDINGIQIKIQGKYKKVLDELPKVKYCTYANSLYKESNGRIGNECSCISIMSGFIGIDNHFY